MAVYGSTNTAIWCDIGKPDEAVLIHVGTEADWYYYFAPNSNTLYRNGRDFPPPTEVWHKLDSRFTLNTLINGVEPEDLPIRQKHFNLQHGWVLFPPRCYGAQTADGKPDCDGSNVRKVRVEGWEGKEFFDTEWCTECRREAVLAGAEVTFL